MKRKYPFIRVVDLLLRIIWYMQCIFAIFLILSAIFIIAEVDFINLDKINGFHISYAKIEMGEMQLQDMQSHNVTITNGEGRVHISGMNQKIAFFRIIAAMVELAVGMFIIYLLRKIFTNLKKGDFFVRKNGVMLRKIAISILGVSLFLNAFQYAISSYIYNTLSLENIELKRTANLDTRTLLFGIMLFVVSMIFIKGAELQEEQDLTI